MNKTCKVCGFEGDANLFAKNRRVCNLCMSAYQKKYRANNKDTVSLQQKEWRHNNVEIVKINKKKYYEENFDSISDKSKLYYENNKLSIKERVFIYRKNNKDKRSNTERNRRKNDPNYKLRTYLSRDIFRSVKSKKGLSTFKILPYSVLELRAHLEGQFEPWMNWNNYGRYNSRTWNDNSHLTWTWQIDHIIPRSFFNYTDIYDPQFIKCWSLSNLRPLSSKINLISGSKLKRKKK